MLLFALLMFAGTFILSGNWIFTKKELLTLLESEKVLSGYKYFFFSMAICVLLLCSLQTTLKKYVLQVEQWYFKMTEGSYQEPVNEVKPLWLTIFICSFLGFGIFVVYLVISSPLSYSHLVREDGPIEYTSSILWFLAMGIQVYMSISIWNSQRRKVKFYILFSLFFFICGMEEISWGQRILGIKTPDIVSSFNRQEEFNLHNIGSISLQANIFFFITIIFFVLIPLIKRFSKDVSNFLYNIQFPWTGFKLTILWCLAVSIWIFVGLYLGNLGFSPLTWKGNDPHLDDEIIELYFALLYFAYAIFDMNHQKRSVKFAAVRS